MADTEAPKPTEAPVAAGDAIDDEIQELEAEINGMAQETNELKELAETSKTAEALTTADLRGQSKGSKIGS